MRSPGKSVYASLALLSALMIAMSGPGAASGPGASSPAAGAAPSIVLNSPCQWREPLREAADVLVSTRDELRSAIDAGSRLIWIENGSAIDLAVADHRSGAPDYVFQVPDHTTIASGRSPTQPGGLLYFSRRLEKQVFMLRLGQCSRVTGLRLRGPSRSTARGAPQVLPPWPKYPRTTAIHVVSTEDHVVDHVFVDNNEFSDWPGAGVQVQEVPTTYATARNIRITNNFFHHNLMCGSGYGVVLDGNHDSAAIGGYAYIDRNVFNYNRHAIAGDGHRTSGYVAERNLVLSGGEKCDNGILGDPGYYEQHFDMHGDDTYGDAVDDHDGYGGNGGEVVTIRYNTVRGEQKYYVTQTRPAFYLRGTPTEYADFFGNVVAHDDRDEAIKIYGHVTNLREWGNQYDVDTSTELAVGDFDGDRAADVFQATGTVWVFSARGQGEWRHLNNRGERLSQLRFGDFDGNGKTDVITQVGTGWRVSSDGVGPWRPLPATAEIGGQPYRLGDFDADGKTDIFRASGTQWSYSSGGGVMWLPLASSTLREGSLRFGDFDGDGATDVFSFAKGQWSVSDGGARDWRRLNALISSRLTELVFADFDGDGVTDIARQNGVGYEVSWGGTTSWRSLHSAASVAMPLRLNAMLVGDFNRDRRADVLHYERSPLGSGVITVGKRFVMSSGASQAFALRSRHEMR